MMEASRYFFSLTKTIQDNKVAYTRLKQILDLESDENAGVELKDISQIRLKNIMHHRKKWNREKHFGRFDYRVL